MAERPSVNHSTADIRSKTVASAKTVDAYLPVKRSGADDAVEKLAAIGDDATGIAIDAGTAGQKVRVIENGGTAEVLVGTGGATKGAPAKWVSDGLTNATIGGGTTKLTCLGRFKDTGVAGDRVGLDVNIYGTVGS